MRWWLLLVVIAGCRRPADFQLTSAELYRARNESEWTSELDARRKLQRNGAVIFVSRDGKRSPMVRIHDLTLGKQGVCVSESADVATFWEAIQIDPIDRRAAHLLLAAPPALRVQQVSETAWRIEGTSAALRDWVPQHLRRAEDTNRKFIDLHELAYQVRTPVGWMPITAKELGEDAKRSWGWRFGRKHYRLIGWRWSNIARVDYYDFLDQGGHPMPEKDIVEWVGVIGTHWVRYAVQKRSGFYPLPCPLRETGSPVFLPR